MAIDGPDSVKAVLTAWFGMEIKRSFHLAGEDHIAYVTIECWPDADSDADITEVAEFTEHISDHLSEMDGIEGAE